MVPVMSGGKCLPLEYQAAAAACWLQMFVTDGKVCSNVTGEIEAGFIQRGEREDGKVNQTKYNAFLSVCGCQERSK